MDPEFRCHPKYSRIFDIIPWMFVGGVDAVVIVIVIVMLCYVIVIVVVLVYLE